MPNILMFGRKGTNFYHYLCKGAAAPHLPEADEQNLIVIEAFLEATHCPGGI